jgi:hypothetical protein
LTRSLPDLADARDWIAPIRVVIAPFALLEVAIERGNYPPGHETWAWATAGVFVVGAVAFFLTDRRRGDGGAAAVAALVLDTAVVSAFVVIYGFEPGSPVRQLLVLVVVEAALRYGKRGAVWAVTSAPALAAFEWRVSDRLELPYDPGHVVFPIGIQLLIGLIVGSLAVREPAEEPS